MGIIGNKGTFQTTNVASATSTTLFFLTLAGGPNTGFNLQGLKVVSTSGCSDFVVRLYEDDQQIDVGRATVEILNGTVIIDHLNQTVPLHGTIRGKVIHFDTGEIHDFETVLWGAGSE